jgi:hypothetical protein
LPNDRSRAEGWAIAGIGSTFQAAYVLQVAYFSAPIDSFGHLDRKTISAFEFG